MDNMALYHWSPSARRKQILRYGLRPGMASCISSVRTDHVCFADTPSWAWALSAGMPWAEVGDWDLWQVWSNRLGPGTVIASDDRPSGVHEVRVTSRVYKRDLWYAGTRSNVKGST